MQVNYTAASLKEVADYFREKAFRQHDAANNVDDPTLKNLHRSVANAYQEASDMLRNLTIVPEVETGK